MTKDKNTYKVKVLKYIDAKNRRSYGHLIGKEIMVTVADDKRYRYRFQCRPSATYLIDKDDCEVIETIEPKPVKKKLRCVDTDKKYLDDDLPF